MSKQIEVKTGESTGYRILIEQSFDRLKEALLETGCENKKICIVTEDHVSAFYLTPVYNIVSEVTAHPYMFAFHAGENSKTLDTVRDLYQALIRQEFGRKDILIALGGGVTGDICGFAAATYLRGISFIQIPTSLLAQVDSSIGGKTGVDFLSYKNMVGAFHMPSLVYINITTLQTLPEREFSSGMGEIIKHGLIADRRYYEMLSEKRQEIKKRDPGVCEEMVYGSDLIKREIVQKDPSENGIRAMLNFGHTLGHAIEKESGFTLIHGECVGLGILCAMRICVSRKLITEDDLKSAEKLLSFYGLPVKVSGLNPGKILDSTRHDKKMVNGHIRFILLHEPGSAFIDETVTENEMREALEQIYEK